MEYLSDIELYYSPLFENERVKITGDECKHIVNVMRHKPGDRLFVTNGMGLISQCEISEIFKNEVECRVIRDYHYENLKTNFVFCIPKLRMTDRFDFALEKSVELGITKFVIYEGERGIKKGDKPERWQKIATAAMKQSLQSYLPEIQLVKDIKSIIDLGGEVIYLDQNSEKWLENEEFDKTMKYYFVFGPEGGFSEREVEMLKKHTGLRLKMNRLRSETAIITAASLLH